MRGKVSAKQLVTMLRGITPAYAGKRQQQRTRLLHSWDHPRLCGEKQIIRLMNVYCQGSPPPMRGKGFCNAEIAVEIGITPAYAGKS